MKPFNVAILGCGVVGSGVAKILIDMQKKLSNKASRQICLKGIIELFPKKAIDKYNIPANYFYGGGKDLYKEEASEYINEIISSDDIDLVVETIGGKSDELLNIILRVLKSKKHLVTANKAMLAINGKKIFEVAKLNGSTIGYEASVCGAIPIIKTINDSFSGDEIVSISGILNGTSNYILSKMHEERLDFDKALKLAQDNGYAEADPSLDINGGDAGHKLAILIKQAFGASVDFDNLSIEGIEKITADDLDFAEEMDCKLKLICFAESRDNKIFAAVKPMLVKKENFLSSINGATNAVQLINKYSGRHILIGAGAGSLETASSIVADIVYIAKYSDNIMEQDTSKAARLIDNDQFISPYNIIFESEDIPGITGFITTAIGSQEINIDTVSHNRHTSDRALFSIATMACTLRQVNDAIAEINSKRPDVLIKKPKIMPILY